MTAKAQEAQAKKEKKDKLNFIRTKTFFVSKIITKKVKT